MAKQTPLELATAIQKLLQTTESNSDPDSKELRLEACGLAIKLFKELEEPGDTVSRVMGQVGYLIDIVEPVLTYTLQTTEMMVLLAAIEMKVLDSLVQSDGAVSSNDIASQTKADQALVYRILRFLAAHLYVDEIDVDLFKANKSTLAFSMPKSVAGFKYVYVIPCNDEINSDIPRHVHGHTLTQHKQQCRYSGSGLAGYTRVPQKEWIQDSRRPARCSHPACFQHQETFLRHHDRTEHHVDVPSLHERRASRQKGTTRHLPCR